MKYANFKANLAVLKTAHEQDLSNEFILVGIIDKFAMQFELSWKLLQKTLRFEGSLDAAIGSPRGIIKAAYKAYDFIDEELWLRILADRNTSEHVYDKKLAQRLTIDIIDTYIEAFEKLQYDLENLYPQDLLESL